MKYLLIFFCVAFSFSQNVIELSPKSLKEIIVDNEMGFIFFFSPESPYCQSILQTYNILPQIIKNKQYTHTITISKLNIDKYEEIKNIYSIKDVPTILWFNNIHNYLTEYFGDTETTDNFVNFIDKQIEFSSNYPREISYDDFYNSVSFKSITPKTNKTDDLPNQNLILICEKNKEQFQKEFKIIINSAFNIGITKIFFSKDKKFDKDCDTNMINVLIFKLNDKGNKSYEKIEFAQTDFLPKSNGFQFEPFTHYLSEKIEKIFEIYSLNRINLFTHKTEELISKGIPTLVIAHNFTSHTKEYETFINNLSYISDKYRKDISILIGSPKTKFTQLFVESFKINENNLPLLCLTAPSNNTIIKYRDEINKNISINEIIIQIQTFIEKYIKGNLLPYISTEKIPDEVIDKYGVHHFVVSNYIEAMKEQKDILIYYCSPRLEICNNFVPRLQKLASRLQKSNNLIIGEINPYTNEINAVDFNYLPGIVLFKDIDNQKKKPIEYKGRLIIKDIFNFLKDNVSHDIIIDEITQETMIKDEMINELKRIDINNLGTWRKVYHKLNNPEQMKLYLIDNKEDIQQEEDYILKHLDKESNLITIEDL